MSEQQYKHLTHEDTIQAGDEFWTGSAWFEYHEDCIGRFVHIDPSRRPIANAIDQSQRERIAYEELRPGDVIQPGDQWWPKDGTNQWQGYHQGMFGLQVLDASIARRPHNITALLAERDEARAEVQRLQEVVRNLYSEPTARQVQQMLRTWATELDWSAGCFDSVARDEIDTIQKTLVAVIERIETMINPEGGSDDN